MVCNITDPHFHPIRNKKPLLYFSYVDVNSLCARAFSTVVPERFPLLCQTIFTVRIVFRGDIGNWFLVWLIFV